MADFRPVRIVAIEVEDRFRAFSPEHAEKLTTSFTDYGRTAPIIVRPKPGDPERFLLVAGLHRLEGARSAGLSVIDAEVRALSDDEARRVEIAENAFRVELTALDRMRSFAELADLYEKEHPKNPGGRPSKNPGKVGQHFAARFSKEAQKKAKLSERSIRLDVQVARSLDPEVVKLVSRHVVADNAAQLKLLASYPADRQILIAQALVTGRASDVRRAVFETGIATKVQQDPQEVLVTKVVNLVARSSARSRRRIAEHLVKKSPADAEGAALLEAVWNAARPGAREEFLTRTHLQQPEYGCLMQEALAQEAAERRAAEDAADEGSA